MTSPGPLTAPALVIWGEEDPWFSVAHADAFRTILPRAKLEKIPYILVVGDDDVEKGTLGVNARGSNDPERGVSVAAFRQRLLDEVATHGSPEGR